MLKDSSRSAIRSVGLVFLVNGAAMANWMARIPAVREHLSLTHRSLGLVLLATAVGAMVMFQLAGGVIHRHSSRKVTWVSALAYLACLPLPGLAHNAWELGAALFVFGCGHGMLDVAMNAQSVEVEHGCRRPVLSRIHGLYSLGGLIGAGQGALAAYFEVGPAWHLLTVALLFMAVLAAGARHMVPDRQSPPVRMTRPSNTLLLLGLVGFCSAVGEGAMADWTAVYARDLLHVSMTSAALVYAVFCFAMLVGRFAGDWVTARVGAERVVRLGGLGVAAGLGAGLYFNHPAVFVGGLIFVGLGLAVVIPVVFRTGSNLPDVSPGAALAVMSSLSYTGMLAGPPMIGFLSERVTLRGGLLVVVALALLLAALAPAAAGQRPRFVPRQALRWLAQRSPRLAARQGRAVSVKSSAPTPLG